MEQVATEPVKTLTPAAFWKDFDPKFTDEKKIVDNIDQNGRPVKLVLRNDGGIWIVKKGKGRDAEEALRIAGTNRDLYMSAMMSRTITNALGVFILPEDLGDLDLDEYLRLQAAFAEINF